MFALTFGGEMTFSPPCHLPRYYRPMVLEVLGLSNANLGEAVACCGIAAVIGYFPSGILVDHLSARRLMTTWPGATAVGVMYLMACSDLAVAIIGMTG